MHEVLIEKVGIRFFKVKMWDTCYKGWLKVPRYLSYLLSHWAGA